MPPSPLDSPQHMRHRLPIGAALPNKESMIRELEQLAASIPPIGVGELTRQYQARSPTRSVAATLKHKTSAYSIGGLSGYSEVASGYSVEMFPGEASDEQVRVHGQLERTRTHPFLPSLRHGGETEHRRKTSTACSMARIGPHSFAVGGG